MGRRKRGKGGNHDHLIFFVLIRHQEQARDFASEATPLRAWSLPVRDKFNTPARSFVVVITNPSLPGQIFPCLSLLLLTLTFPCLFYLEEDLQMVEGSGT